MSCCGAAFFALLVFSGAGAAVDAEGATAPCATVPDLPPMLGIVIGSNRSPDGRAALAYADDDAAKSAQLLRELGAEVTLLTSPDAETHDTFPDLRAAPPTHEAVAAAFATVARRVAEMRPSVAVVYVFYSGHGGIEEGEGFVQLEDGRLTRSELRAFLRELLPAEVHVIVDACKSYFAVFDRGAGGERHALVAPLLANDEQTLSGMGFLLSTSAATDSHEWEAYQGGVFSHEVRSAMRGAADLDGDGVINYREAAAFIWSANQSIPNRRFRPAFFARSGDNNDRPLVRLRGAPGHVLMVGQGVERHLFVEDHRGVRLADLHPSRATRLALHLPATRPLFVREGASDAEVSLPDEPVVELSAMRFSPSTAHARSAAHVAFTSLFATPFSQASVQAYDAAPIALELPAVEPPPRVAGPVLLAAASLFVTAGIAFSAMGREERSRGGVDTSGASRVEINTRIDRDNVAAWSCYGAGLITGAVYLAYRLWGASATTADEPTVAEVGP